LNWRKGVTLSVFSTYIPKFFRNKEPVFFLSKYLDSDRLLGIEYNSFQEFGKLLSNNKSNKKPAKKKSIKVKIRKLDGSDVEQITEIYRVVFLSYPFPIHNPGYIHKSMKENVRYFGVEKKDKLIAVASAEIDLKGSNAEMTDFATLPNFSGMDLAHKLLVKMEKEMKVLGIQTLYTIARLKSIPMNKIFLKSKYDYAGTLIRNSNIAGELESMNVYYKHI
jgi:putative beta-lysine N-acetyltransferase